MATTRTSDDGKAPAVEHGPAEAVPASLRVAVLQLSSDEELERNLERAHGLAARAARAGAELVVLPENFAYFGPETGRRRFAEALGKAAPIQDALRGMARSLGVCVVAGGFPEASPDPERPYNTCLVLGRDGQELGVYRKMHLFDVRLGAEATFEESKSTLPGDAPVVSEVAGFRLGLSICYDLRFPELYRALAEQGAEMLAVPAAFTRLTGKDHWHVLLRARAIESQCYVLAAAQWGGHPGGRTTYGHALIVDPWGTVVAEASDGEGFALASVERERILDVRRRMPCASHRRL